MVMEFKADSPEEAARIVAAIEEETKKLGLDATITTIDVQRKGWKGANWTAIEAIMNDANEVIEKV